MICLGVWVVGGMWIVFGINRYCFCYLDMIVVLNGVVIVDIFFLVCVRECVFSFYWLYFLLELVGLR